ncbi:MAG: hypothetical protein JWN70_6859, partial [Planctomycetaceae bacterium]|nr:hypothetical protein [Planctomycetaceae bacterium]
LALQLGGTHYYSVAKAQQDFGYQCPVSIGEGMRRMAADWKNLLK